MEWIEVANELPKDGVPVIAFVTGCFGNSKATRRIRAQYAGKFSLPQSDECDGGEYDEATDQFYCDEGWYESNVFEETHWAVDGTVTHWMPLPEPPPAKARSDSDPAKKE